jgi:hypothetical protein
VPTVLRALLLAVLLTVIPVAVGVAMTGGEQPAKPAAYAGTPLRQFDTTTVPITRAPFCERIPGDAVTAALGSRAARADAYGNGDREQVGTTDDIVHEYGCTFTSGKVQARAWVFAPPVTRARATELIKASDHGCTRPTGAARFGTPTTASLCGRSVRTATYRGLFGDAWLSCSLSVPGGGMDGATLLDHTGQWCVAVAKAAETPAS